MSGDEDHYAFDGMYFNPDAWAREWYHEDPRDGEDECNYEDGTRSEAPGSSQSSERNDEELKPIKTNLIDLRTAQKISEAVKLIAVLDNKVQIKNKVIKKLFHDNLDEMIFQYYIKEKVSSFEYIKIAKQKNCLRILISGYLKRHGDYTLTQDINDEIDGFVDGILRNDDLEIVYQRVHRIQKFIHSKIDQKHGMGSHLSLPVKQIKDLLSTARLHLNIHDFTYRDVNSLAYIINQSNQQADAEMKNPAKTILPKGKKYNKGWRVGHLQAIIFKPIENKVDEILKLDKNLSTDKFKELIVNIYARN